jgi:hypothetical protein
MMQYRINSLLQLQRMGPQFYTVLVQDIPDEVSTCLSVTS